MKQPPRIVWMAGGGAVIGIVLVASVGSAARGCRTSGQVGELDQRVARIEGALGMGDAGAIPSADLPAAGDGGAGASADVTPECAVAKVAAYHAWQDALTKAKAL